MENFLYRCNVYIYGIDDSHLDTIIDPHYKLYCSLTSLINLYRMSCQFSSESGSEEPTLEICSTKLTSTFSARMRIVVRRNPR